MEFVDLKTQYLLYKKEIDENIQKNINNSTFILGNDVKILEKKLAEYVDVNFAIGVSSGTDALLLALMAYDIKEGDEIITTPFTFIATTEVITFLKAKPVFVDIDEKTYNINPELIKEKITSKTKGIIAVSIFGQVCDFDKINQLAKENNLFVIEDAAQSFGAIYKGRKSCSLTNIATTSFFPSKPLGCYGDGGMVFTNDENLAKKMRYISNHGQKEKYIHEYVGLNMRLDTLQAAILIAKFNHFENEVQKRMSIGLKYNELLKNLPIITPYIADYTNRHVFAQYSIRVKNRAKVIQHLNNNNIPTAIHYPLPIYMQKAYQFLGYRKGDFPICEKICDEIMSIPIHPFLKDEDIEYIVNKIKEVV